MIRSLPAVTFVALLAAGCAPAEKPEPEPVLPERTLIEALPADARCRAIGSLDRRDAQLAPLTIDPQRLGFPVAITCEAPGHFATTELLHARPQPSLIEGLANGAQISAMADPEPAAGAQQTSLVSFRITVRLRQPLFDTQGARDAFYDAIKAERQARWAEIGRRAEIGCEAPEIPRAGASSTSPPEICRQAYRAIEVQRDADLRQVEIDRRRATFR